jgi:tetratricopeptide (TPR) repeat protein
MRNLGSIITDTYIYRAHVARALMYGLEEGFIKKTVLPELKGLSTNAVTRVDAEAYLPLLKNAVKYAADELGARERLAVVFERLQRIDEAVIQYNYIGDALYLGRKMAKALKAYQKAIQLKPDEILVTEKITKIYMQAAVQERDRGNTAQALQLLMSALWLRPTDKDILVKALPMLAAERKVKEIQDLCDRICLHARQTRSPDGAVQALTTIVNAFPKSAAFRKKLVNVLLDFGKNAEASAELQVLAKQCLEHGQADKAQELMEKARRVGSARLLARDLERRVTQRTSKTRSRIRRIVVMGLIAASTCEIWSYWDWNHVSEASATVEAASHPRSRSTASSRARRSGTIAGSPPNATAF